MSTSARRATARGPETGQRTKGVDSARRALSILMQFSEARPFLTVDDLLANHDISRPSAYRYLALLREMNLIEEHSKGSFVLTSRVMKLARAADAGLGLRHELQPVLDRLRETTGESARFIRRLNDSVVCVALSESDHPVSLSFQLGTLMPLHGGAAAKTLLADASPAERRKYLDNLQPSLSEEARLRLHAEMDTIAELGYAESLSEVDAGIWAAAHIVRVEGRTVGSVTVAAPAYRLDEQKRRGIFEAVRDAALELERTLSEPE